MKNNILCGIALIIGILLAFIAPAKADIHKIAGLPLETESSWSYKDGVLHLTGLVDENMENAVQDHMGKVDEIRISSMGGKRTSANNIAHIINEEGIYVHVDTHCMSACVLMFAAAPYRTVSKDATIAVHYVWSLFNGFTAEPTFAIKMDSTRAYFSMIEEYAGIDLLTPYNAVMIERGMIHPNSVNASIFYTTKQVDGIKFPTASFWTLDHDEMVDQGFIHNFK